MRMVISMKGTGKMIRQKDMVIIYIVMVLYMLDIGVMIYKMVKEKNSKMMVHNMKGNMFKAKNKVMEKSYFVMDHIMKDNLLKIKSQGLDVITDQMVRPIPVNGSITK